MNYYLSVPEDTRRAAQTLYGKGHLYLRLGDQLEELLVGLGQQERPLWSSDSLADQDGFQCAMLTVFQYLEELANQPMLEALRNRVDLRYALHLPLNSLSIDSQKLCDFRRLLLNDPSRVQVFQLLLDRLQAFGLFASAMHQPASASELLTAVCTINRFEEVTETMHRALECLAVANPEWLRQIAMPLWYDRYNRRRKFSPIPITDLKWNARVLQIGADIRYLLGKIDQSNNPHLTSLEEIKEIRRIWDEQFLLTTTGTDGQPLIQWGLSRCASCKLLSDVNH